MTCQDAQNALETYLDGELDLTRSLEIEQHIEGCADCTGFRNQFEQLRRVLHLDGVYQKAPAELEPRLRASLELSARAPLPSSGRSPWTGRVLALAASIVILIALGAVVAGILRRSSERNLLAQEVVSNHIRSLMANHLSDVPSTDQHTVKPWFNGKLDFAPVVKDLSGRGYPLIGGRLDYLDGHPVAALQYKHRQHFINLFIWPSAASDSTPRALTVRGYNLVEWTKAKMNYWAVSDLNAAELQEFARMFSE